MVKFLLYRDEGRAMVISIVLIVIAACSEAPPECNKYNSFFDLPISERENQLHQYPVEQQVDICVCGMRREPPTIYLADPLAEAGDVSVPLIVSRLASERSEAGQRNLIYLLRALSEHGYLRGRTDVVGDVRARVAKMQDNSIRESAQAMLDTIETNLSQ
jgi:hypothetical protein